MGFLNQTTNNIIVDAVLTDLGRQLLARNDGSFNIVKFALADNEVDYSIIQQYGRQVGKDKIEKNTPVFEASTNVNVALKYKVVSISNPVLTYMPSIMMTFVNGSQGTQGTSQDVVSLSRLSKISTFEVALNQVTTSNNLIAPELIDNSFEVRVNDLFLGLQGLSPDAVDANNNASYIIDRDASLTTSGGASAKFTLRLKSFSQTLFDTYKSNGLNVVRTYVRVTGINSGTVKEFEVRIS
jgi:hypothetical protein